MPVGVDAAMLWGMLLQPPPVRTSPPPTTPWGAASLGLGIFTLLGAVTTIAAWPAMSGPGPLTVSVAAVAVFSVAAIATGVYARRVGPSGTTGRSLGLAGIITGVLGIVVPVVWFVLAVAFVLLIYLFVAIAFGLSGADLTGVVHGAGM